MTNKRFPGNPAQSYRTRHPLRVVSEPESWQGHDPEVLHGMLDHLARLREQGLDVIEDESHAAHEAQGSAPSSRSVVCSIRSPSHLAR